MNNFRRKAYRLTHKIKIEIIYTKQKKQKNYNSHKSKHALLLLWHICLD